MNLQDEHIRLWIDLFMKRTDEQSLFMFTTTVTAEATINKKNMLGLGKKKLISPILIDSHFYEPISIIKSQ